jgi:hypothetical protein
MAVAEATISPTISPIRPHPPHEGFRSFERLLIEIHQ